MTEEEIAALPVLTLPKDDGAVSRRGHVQPGEEGVAEVELPGTPIQDLAIPALKALAKHRGIVLGVRKDKRSEILAALEAGE